MKTLLKFLSQLWPPSWATAWLVATLLLISFIFYARSVGLQNWQFVELVAFFFVLNSVLLFVGAEYFPTIRLVMVTHLIVLELVAAGFFVIHASTIFQ
jgi:hypothetical protein